MASIRKLPSGNWNVQIRSKGKIFATRTLSTRQAAERWGIKKEKELNLKHPYFYDCGHAYCHEVLGGKPSQRSSSYRIDRISRYDTMSKTVDKITLQDVNSYKQTRLAEVSPSTCRDEVQMIRRVFRWYIREYLARTGVQLTNPCDLITIPQASKPRDRVVSREELKLLISAMTPQMAMFTELAYETAMRRGELVKLKPKDLFLDQRFLRVVDGKEGSRDVPLTRRAVELLEAALKDWQGQGCPALPNQTPESLASCQAGSSGGGLGRRCAAPPIATFSDHGGCKDGIKSSTDHDGQRAPRYSECSTIYSLESQRRNRPDRLIMFGRQL